jgi:hypothetical protein
LDLIPFLNKAIIIADFHICGNLPVCREQLMQNEVNGEFVVNDEDKANLLNTFFCSISEIIDSDLPTPIFDKQRTAKNNLKGLTDSRCCRF